MSRSQQLGQPSQCKMQQAKMTPLHLTWVPLAWATVWMLQHAAGQQNLPRTGQRVQLTHLKGHQRQLQTPMLLIRGPLARPPHLRKQVTGTAAHRMYLQGPSPAQRVPQQKRLQALLILLPSTWEHLVCLRQQRMSLMTAACGSQVPSLSTQRHMPGMNRKSSQQRRRTPLPLTRGPLTWEA